MRVKKVCNRCRERKDALNEFSSRIAKICANCSVACLQLNRSFDEMLNDPDYSELRELDEYFDLHYGDSA